MRTVAGYSFVFANALNHSLLALGQPKCSGQAQPLLVGPATLKPADFRYMLRGYCTADSDRRETKALGGFWQLNNTPKDLDASAGDLRNDVHLVAKPNEVKRFANVYRGATVLLVKGTRKRQVFSACGLTPSNSPTNKIKSPPQSWIPTTSSPATEGDAL